MSAMAMGTRPVRRRAAQNHNCDATPSRDDPQTPECPGGGAAWTRRDGSISSERRKTIGPWCAYPLSVSRRDDHRLDVRRQG
jgi:hypothetical protein